ncbi:PilW family protein [Roseateles sp. GG27B]
MKRQPDFAVTRQSAGLTLIELMIAMAIGLIVVATALTFYLNAAQATRMAEAKSRMEEDGQAALSILVQQIRMAGSNPEQPDRNYASRRNPVYTDSLLPSIYNIGGYKSGNYSTSHFMIRGCGGLFKTTVFTTNTDDIDHLDCVASTSDSVAVSYEADVANTVAASGVPTDCSGSPLSLVTAFFDQKTPTAEFAVSENRFYIAAVNGVSSLYCEGNGSTAARPMVENIEAMSISYGTASLTGSVVAGYLSAAGVDSAPSLASLPLDQRWAKVLTVRVCLLVRSEAAVLPDTGSAGYIKCDGSLEANPPDLRMRRTFSTTVALRNRFL